MHGKHTLLFRTLRSGNAPAIGTSMSEIFLVASNGSVRRAIVCRLVRFSAGLNYPSYFRNFVFLPQS